MMHDTAVETSVSHLALATLLATAGCAEAGDGAPEFSALASRSSDIIGGTEDTGDPAVVALVVDGLLECSGTLIGARTVMTAGHCYWPDATTVAIFGATIATPAETVTVDAQERHPLYGGEGKPHDLALFRLLTSVTNVEPARINVRPLTDGDVGKIVRHVGYGVTNDVTQAGGGIKRTVEYPVNRIDADFIYSGTFLHQTCTRDSGAPAFMTLDDTTEIVVGVVSDGPSCLLPGDGWDVRVDTATDWVQGLLASWEPLAPVSDSGPTIPEGGPRDGGSENGGSSDGGPRDDARPSDMGGNSSASCSAVSTSMPWGVGLLIAMSLPWRRHRGGGRRLAGRWC